MQSHHDAQPEMDMLRERLQACEALDVLCERIENSILSSGKHPFLDTSRPPKKNAWQEQ